MEKQQLENNTCIAVYKILIRAPERYNIKSRLILLIIARLILQRQSGFLIKVRNNFPLNWQNHSLLQWIGRHTIESFATQKQRITENKKAAKSNEDRYFSNFTVIDLSRSQKKCFFFLQVFVGSSLLGSNRNEVITTQLPEPKKARFLRVKPIEWHGAIALRMEIYGCMRGELFPVKIRMYN